MAHNDEPMDIDHMDSDFDNKENSIQHSNVYPRTPCTEKGYEELDVSELNMKLRYSITPAASPMSKSYTANCADNRTLESDETLNANLTRSLHSAMSKGDKSLKALPLQTISTEQFVDNNRNSSVLRPLDSTVVIDDNVMVTVTQPTDIDENVSFPSSSSSNAQTPEANTPTKDILRSDGGSPIMRGLKSVLNMFRSSQSPIPPVDCTEITSKQVLSPADISTSTLESSHVAQAVLASTPIAVHNKKEGNLSKRSSPHKESLVFNEDLEKELLWKDETTIMFSQEKIPIHKLFLQQTPCRKDTAKVENNIDNLNSTVEYMDISYNDSMNKNKTITDIQSDGLNESDGEFLDCETTFTNKSEIPNESIDNEDNGNPPNAIVNETNVIGLVNAETTQQLLKAELPQFNATKLLNEKEEKEIEMETKSKQMYDVLNAATAINFDETAGINAISNFTNYENTNIDKIIEESKTLEKSNFELEKEESKSLQTDKLPTNITFESCRSPTEEIVLKPDNKVGNITRVLSDSQLNFVEPPNNVINSNFVQPIEGLPIDSNVVNTTYISKDENATFVKETVTDHSGSETFCKQVERSSLILDDTNTIVASKTEEATFIKELGNTPLLLGANIAMVATGTTDATFIKELLPLDDTITIVPVKFDAKEGGGVQETNNIKISSKSINVQSTDQEDIALPCDSNRNTNISAFIEDTIAKGIEHVPDDNTNFIPTDKVGYNTFVSEIEKDSALAEKNTTSTPSTEVDLHDSPANIPLPDEDDIENEKSLCAHMLPEEKIIHVINSTEVTKLENEFNVEKMPIIKTKLKEVNNYSIKDGDSSEFKIENKLEKIDVPDSPKISSHKFSIDINEGGTEEQVEVQQKTFTHEGLMDNLDISMAEIGVDVNNDTQPIIKDQENVPEIIHTELLGNNILENLQPELYNLVVNNIVPDVIDEQISMPKLTEDFAITSDDNCMTNQVNKLEVTGLGPEELLDNATITTKSLMTLPPDEQNKLDVTNVDKHITQIVSNITMEVNNEIIKTIHNNEVEVLYSDTLEKKDEIINNVEEIILSENNSPYVSTAGKINSTNIDEIQNPLATKSRVVLTPPTSPIIESKGYNFNFDEIDDPFATKTKIRMSPAPDASPKELDEEKVEQPQRDTNKNRRKSQPERKRPLNIQKNKLNSTFSGLVKTKADDVRKLNSKSAVKTNYMPLEEVDKEPASDVTFLSNDGDCRSGNKTADLDSSNTNNTFNKPMIVDPVPKKSVDKDVPKEQKSLDDRDVDTSTEVKEENKSLVESLNCVSNEITTTSSSEQSTYYSLGTSSGESTVNKSVFNIPEIDDMNFNPFVTKSKMRQSPPPGLFEDVEKDCFTKPDTTFSEVNKVVSEDMASKTSVTADEKESANISNITCSSKATEDIDITVREVHTEDEDTQEGPFFEADAMSDFDGEDVEMMQFSELPPQNNVENLETGEMFIDAEAFEFLLNQNKTNVVSDSGKESLFLKFDPLFSKRVSTDGVLAALNKIQKRQSTPKKIALAVQMDATFEKPVPGPSKMNVTHEVETTTEESAEDLNVTVSKPMMVVTPAVNPVVTPRNKITTPTSSNRRSITFTSPAIAVIDRLLSLSANNSLVGHDSTVTHVGREQNEADLALTQLRELLADKEINVYNLRSESKELKDRLSSLESQVRTLESESQDRLRKVNELNEKLSEKTKLNKSMAAVVEEYERTIASLIAETEQDKKRHNEERIRLIKERDEQTAHLTSMEVSFSDLHSKYEKSKQIILTCKANEDSYKKSIKEFEENLSKMQSNYELLKQHATSKLNHANQELEKMNRAHESEVLKMNAMLKRKELHITSLEETLAQKTKANEELTAICDELINKVG